MCNIRLHISHCKVQGSLDFFFSPLGERCHGDGTSCLHTLTMNATRNQTTCNTSILVPPRVKVQLEHSMIQLRPY